MNLADIEKQTKDYADARAVLAEAVRDLNDELELAKRQALAGIKRALHKAAKAEAELKAALEAEPELFEKPKTQIFHGVKVGYRKSSGKIEWEDDDQVVKLIKKYHEELADVLIKTTEKPIKKALQELDAAALKKLGVTVEDTGDVVVIKPVDSEVDKLVAALLKDAVDEAQE
jgi:tetratricopeptide (TPR) repeat protein